MLENLISTVRGDFFIIIKMLLVFYCRSQKTENSLQRVRQRKAQPE